MSDCCVAWTWQLLNSAGNIVRAWLIKFWWGVLANSRCYEVQIFIKSWNHTNGPQEGIKSNLPAQSRVYYARLLRAAFSFVFNYLQGWRHCNLCVGKCIPVFNHPCSPEVFPDVQREPLVFQFVSITSGPVTELHWGEPLSVVFTLSGQVFIYTDKIPQSFSSPG